MSSPQREDVVVTSSWPDSPTVPFEPVLYPSPFEIKFLPADPEPKPTLRLHVPNGKRISITHTADGIVIEIFEQ